MTGPHADDGKLIPDALREELRDDILMAFDVKRWHVGLAPVPRWIRIRAPFMRLWLRITGRW